MISRSSLVTCALALSLALGPAGAQSRATLGYRLPQGDSYALNVSFNANVPTQGQIAGSVTTKTRVESVLPDFLRLKISVASAAGGGYNLAMGEDLSPAGNASNITGVDMNNDKDAMIAKDIASLALPALPDGDVAIGSRWESERPVYLPKAPFPGVPSVVRVHFTHTVKSIAPENGRDVVTVTVTGTQPAGQAVKVNLTGFWVLDAATGKPLRAKFEGEASLHVVFTDMKLPFKVEASGTLADALAAR